ncbi:glycoside hydrolase family 5 protein [Apodospora peruviana]|uniref:Glycoside hydrolase family 5 protein n=1 Tax=Apodospora peruviana TaxID=516989 RepID=A0AAE0M1S7_9PEZI|nr:glycoside hydrolase family 5 protein [Apodospora peruviana]
MRLPVNLLLSMALLTATASAATSWPNGPLQTKGRWITDASGGRNVTYVGVSWPAHGETMVPEGLQYRSVASIVEKVKSLGMNAIRLTYAIEMIDQVYENDGKDVPIWDAFVAALGKENGTKVFGEVVNNNPEFGESTTRLEVFDAIAAECAKQQIYLHLDNHVSKASWCCNPFDGNSWWEDKFFDTENWLRGLSFMARHGKRWPALTSMSLRNELRQPLTNTTLYRESYNWQTWYKYTLLGAKAINTLHPDLLIFLSGIDSDTNLTAVVEQTALPGTHKFSVNDFNLAKPNKLLLELHTYITPRDCPSFKETLSKAGFGVLAGDSGLEIPLMMTEFGWTQDATTWDSTVYAKCLREFLPEQKVGWMIWVLAGSYYIREGKQDYDEGWGLVTKDWKAWRSPEFIEGGLKPMVKKTLEGLAIGGTDDDGEGRGSEEGGNGGGATATTTTASSGPTSTSAASSWRGDREWVFRVVLMCSLPSYLTYFACW